MARAHRPIATGSAAGNPSSSPITATGRGRARSPITSMAPRLAAWSRRASTIPRMRVRRERMAAGWNALPTVRRNRA